MRVVGLVSGGKDSCYNLIECLREGHEIVALANLKPEGKDELDSFMYQTVGHDVIDFYAEATGLPLFRRTIKGSSICKEMIYEKDESDEVEDLLLLLKDVKKEIEFEAVSVGAILSDYQRIRVENVCHRLGLKSLSYLWRRDQDELLEEMIDSGINAIIIKVAALGLNPRKHLSLSIKEMLTPLRQLNAKFGLNVCGEGGEYETMTLDCPIFTKKIVVDESEIVIHSEDAFAPVGYLKFSSVHFEDKGIDPTLPLIARLHLSECETQNHSRLHEPEDEQLTFFESRKDFSAKSKPVKYFQDDSRGYSEIAQPFVKRVGNYLHISQLTVNCKDSADISSCARRALEKLKDLLHQHNYTMKHCILVHLYLNDMSKFGQVNEVYKEFFTGNPPSRLCIEVSLAENCPLKIDCLAYCSTKSIEESVDRRDEPKYMFVQSISRWAPANIGPYSQAVKTGKSVFLSGSIGLVPGSMTMVKGGISQEASLSLRHADRVLYAIDASCSIRDAICVTCFVTSTEFIAAARKTFEDCNNGSTWKGIFLASVVPGLPRKALVEWGIIAHACSHKILIEFSSISNDRNRWVINSRICYCSCDNSGFASSNISIDGTCNVEPDWSDLISHSLEDIRQLVRKCESNMDRILSLRVFYIGDMSLESSIASRFAKQWIKCFGCTAPSVSVIKVEDLQDKSSLSILAQLY